MMNDDGDQLQHRISDEEYHILNNGHEPDEHHHDDTCTGHTPDVWICQNPRCGDKLTADTIGRDGPGEDVKLFCTSCSSRDVRLVEMKHPLFNEENFGPQHDLFHDDWPI